MLRSSLMRLLKSMRRPLTRPLPAGTSRCARAAGSAAAASASTAAERDGIRDWSCCAAFGFLIKPGAVRNASNDLRVSASSFLCRTCFGERVRENLTHCLLSGLSTHSGSGIAAPVVLSRAAASRSWEISRTPLDLGRSRALEQALIKCGIAKKCFLAQK